MLTPTPVVVGADLGGTGTRVALCDHEGEVLAVGSAGPGNPGRVGAPVAAENLRRAFDEARREASKRGPLEYGAVCVGMAGRSHPSATGMVRAALGEHLGKVPCRILCEDGEIALWAAFPDGQGVLVHAGTGSGVRAHGPAGPVRLGGWGPVLGDEGSAHAIGLAAMRTACHMAEGRKDRTGLLQKVADRLGQSDPRRWPFLVSEGSVDFPSLFPLVEGEARGGDQVAQGLLLAAADDLAALALDAARMSLLPGGSGLGTAGSVLGKSVLMRDALMRKVRSGTPGLEPGPHVDDPVVGALTLARRSLGLGSDRTDW